MVIVGALFVFIAVGGFHFTHIGADFLFLAAWHDEQGVFAVGDDVVVEFRHNHQLVALGRYDIVVAVHHHRFGALQHVAIVVLWAHIVERSPCAEVGPADAVNTEHRHIVGLFKHGVVDGNALACGVNLFDELLLLVGAVDAFALTELRRHHGGVVDKLELLLHTLAKFIDTQNDIGARSHHDFCVGVECLDMVGCPGVAWSGASVCWLAQYLAVGDFGHLLLHQVHIFAASEHDNIFLWNNTFQSRYGEL